MKTNIIYACKQKLVGIDGILPLLMDLHSRHHNISIIILFYDDNHKREIKKNYHIWQALESIGAEFFVMRDGSIRKFLWRVAFQKNTLIKNSDVLPKHKWFIKILKLISKTTEVKAFITNHTIEAHSLFKIYRKSVASYRSDDDIPVPNSEGDYDHYTSTCDRDLLKSVHSIDVPKSKFKKLGYLRKLPEWTKFMNKEKDKLPYSKRKYCVVYLTGTEPRIVFEMRNYYLTLLEDILTVLKKYNDDILTVFKPHAVSHMERFETLLKQTGYKNYIIDYAHPMIMACNAQFVMAYTYSLTLFDAYYLGKPVVLYSYYPPELVKALGGQSAGGRACDYFINKSPIELDKVVHNLIKRKL